MKQITVRVSAAMVAQVLTQGYVFPHGSVTKGLPPGSRLIGATFDVAHQAVLTFAAPGPEGVKEDLQIALRLKAQS